MFLRGKTSFVALTARVLPTRLLSSAGTPKLPPGNPPAPAPEKPDPAREKFEEEQRDLKARLEKARPLSEMPGPKDYPLIRQSWVFLPVVGMLDTTSISGSYGRLYNEFGKLVHVSIPGKDIVYCFDPVYVSAMFKAEQHWPKRPGLDALLKYRLSLPHEYAHPGIFFAQGEEWEKLRKTAARYFIGGSLSNYIQPILDVNADFVSRIKIIRDREGEVKDFIQELFKWALESIGYISLNKRLGCLDYNVAPFSETQQLIDSLHETFAALHKIESGLPFYKYFKSTNYRRLMKAQSYFHSMIMRYVREGMEDLKTSESVKTDSADPLKGWLLDSFLKDVRLDENAAAVLINDVFFAGIDTTSAACVFVLYHLARNPEKQERLRESLRQAKGSVGSILKDEYLNACINEALRLNPVNVGTARVLQRDMEMGGYRLPAGTVVGAIMCQIARMEEFFDKPKEYIPERFTDKFKQDGVQRVKLEGRHYPFGTGTRHCLGRFIATNEMNLLIATLVLNFRIEYNNPAVESKLRIVNSPDRPINLIFHDIKKK